MRKRPITLLLTVLLPLSSCTSMLDRSFQSLTPHVEHIPAEADTSVPQAETYQGLVNAILYCVTQGTEHSVIRLTNYTRDVEADLAAACLEVVENDPLGAYAVEYITHSWNRIVSYYEVELDISYRRTREQTARIITATGSSTIRAELRRALTGFTPELTLRISPFSGDAAYIESLLREAYDGTPAAALGLPDAEVTLYPETGLQRIVEIRLTYHDDPAVLRNRSAALTAAAVDLATQLPEGELPDRLAAAHTLLQDRAAYLPGEGGSTAYDLLMGGEADSEGFALAASLLCNSAGIPLTIVRGMLDGEPHVWNAIPAETGTVYLDFTRQELRLFGEEEAEELGYVAYP